MIADPSMKLFGSVLRTKILVYLALLEETYVPELALLIGVSRVTVRRAIEELEVEGYVTSTLAGRARWVRINPRNPIAEPLKKVLMRLAEGRPALIESLSQIRRRPRRAGKSLGSANDA